MDPLLDLLTNLVAIDSVNDPAHDRRPTRECPDFIQAELRDRGVSSEVQEWEGLYTVQGKVGPGAPQVLLMSHYDVVPPGRKTRWRHPPLTLTVEEDRAYGRGAVDDKGNVAAIISALPDIAERAAGGVAFAITGDEELGGHQGAARLGEALHPQYVVNGDGIDLQIINRRRNYFWLRVTVPPAPRRTRGETETVRFPTETRGRDTRHSAYFIPGVDSHAFLAGAYHVLRWDLTAARLGGSFVKENVIPDEVEIDLVREARGGSNLVVDDNLTALLKALIPLSRMAFPTDESVYGINALPNTYTRDAAGHHVTLDVRAMTVDVEPVERAAKAILAEMLPLGTVETIVGAGCLRTAVDSPLVRTAKRVATNLGIPPRVVERQGSSDSRFFSPRGVQCIDFGPQGGNLHGPNEYVVVSSLERTEKFYTELVTQLTGEP